MDCEILCKENCFCMNAFSVLSCNNGGFCCHCNIIIRLFYKMSPKSGHFNVTCKLMLLYLPTLKPYNLYCNHQVKSIVKRLYGGR